MLLQPFETISEANQTEFRHTVGWTTAVALLVLAAVMLHLYSVSEIL